MALAIPMLLAFEVKKRAPSHVTARATLYGLPAQNPRSSSVCRTEPAVGRMDSRVSDHSHNAAYSGHAGGGHCRWARRFPALRGGPRRSRSASMASLTQCVLPTPSTAADKHIFPGDNGVVDTSLIRVEPCRIASQIHA